MIRRHAFAATCVLLLLGSSAGTALARNGGPRTNVPRANETPLVVVRSYFAALNRLALQEKNPFMLERWYAPSITVLESLTTGRPRLHSGLRAVHAFNQQNDFSWSMQRFEQLSPTVVLTIERPGVKGPGHELEQAHSWVTLFTLRAGRIITLVWLPTGSLGGSVLAGGKR